MVFQKKNISNKLIKNKMLKTTEKLACSYLFSKLNSLNSKAKTISASKYVDPPREI